MEITTEKPNVNKNKTKIIITLILLLIVVWLSLTYYTGKVIESNQQQYAQLPKEYFNNLRNEIIAMPMPEQSEPLLSFIKQLQLTQLSNYQRGFFSSTLSYTVNDPAMADKSIIIDIKVMHGPLPISSIMNFDFMPKMAQIIATIRKNNLSVPLFELANNKQPLKVTYDHYYNNSGQSELTIAPLSMDNKQVFSGVKIESNQHKLLISPLSIGMDDEKLDFAGATFNLTPLANNRVQINANVGKINLTTGSRGIGLSIDSLNFFIEDELNNIINNEILNSNFNLQINKILLTYPIINLTAKIDSISSQQQSDHHQMINNQALIDKLTINGIDFGSIKSASSIDNINSAALVNLNELNKRYIDNFKKYIDPMDRKIVNDFTQSKPVIKLGPISWKNSQGEAQLNMEIKFKPADLNRGYFSYLSYLLNSTDEVNASLNIPANFSQELATNIKQIDGSDRKTAERDAMTQVTIMQAMLSQDDFIKIDDKGNISSQFIYKNGQASLNGQLIPESVMKDLQRVE